MNFLKKHKKAIYVGLGTIVAIVAIKQVSRMGLFAKIPVVGNYANQVASLL